MSRPAESKREMSDYFVDLFDNKTKKGNYTIGREYKGPGKLLGFVKCEDYRESCSGCQGRLRFQKTADFLKDPKSECGYYDTGKVYRVVKSEPKPKAKKKPKSKRFVIKESQYNDYYGR